VQKEVRVRAINFRGQTGHMLFSTGVTRKKKGLIGGVILILLLLGTGLCRILWCLYTWQAFFGGACGIPPLGRY
jgi:hypothetical protein